MHSALTLNFAASPVLFKKHMIENKSIYCNLKHSAGTIHQSAKIFSAWVKGFCMASCGQLRRRSRGMHSRVDTWYMYMICNMYVYIFIFICMIWYYICASTSSACRFEVVWAPPFPNTIKNHVSTSHLRNCIWDLIQYRAYTHAYTHIYVQIYIYIHLIVTCLDRSMYIYYKLSAFIIYSSKYLYIYIYCIHMILYRDINYITH